MYHVIVKRIAKRNFERINDKDHGAVLASCAPEVHHRFAGEHALGGERHTREAFGRWLGRLARVNPELRLHVTDVWVVGGPWDTTAVVRWEADARLADGSPYRNRGVHVIRMRWGKVVDIDAHEDSQAVAASLVVQAANGISEALAAPIVS